MQRDALDPTSPGTERNPLVPYKPPRTRSANFSRGEQAGLDTRQDREPKRGSQETPLPGPHGSREVGMSLLLSVRSPTCRGQVASERRRGRSPGRWQLTSILQPIAELAAFTDPRLPFLVRLHRRAQRGRARGGGGDRGRVAPRWRSRDSGARRAAALAAGCRLHEAGAADPPRGS